MFRSMAFIALSCLFVTMAMGADKAPQTPSEKAIAKAIKGLEADRDKIDDAIEHAKIDKVIRDLEAAIADPEADPKPGAPKAQSVNKLVVKPTTLKKKFGAKASFNDKTGELTLAYDFTNKNQLSDFDAADVKKVRLAGGILLVDAVEKVSHSAKWNSFNVSAVMTLKSLKGSGIGSSNGTALDMNGPHGNWIGLLVPEGSGPSKEVRDSLRSGRIPVSLMVTPEKAGMTFGDERLAAGTPKKEKDDTHQIILKGGSEGCGFSNLVIVGIPEPTWFAQILDAP